MSRTRPLTGRRGAALLACLAVAATVLTPPPDASGQSVEQARQRYQEIQADLDRITSAYHEQWHEVEHTRGEIAATRHRIGQATDRLGELRGRLQDRVRNAYMMGSAGWIDFLMSGESVREFGLRLTVLERTTTQDEDLLLDLKKTQGQLEAEQRALEGQEEHEEQVLATLGDQQDEMEGLFAQAQQTLSRLEERQRRLVVARSRARASGSSGRVVALAACPVGHPNSFVDSWGAARSGGRGHKGTDIMASRGTPIYAVESGTVSRTGNGGLGGITIWLRGASGHSYYYAHNNSNLVSAGQSVSAGQQIATVGSSGNASGGAPHLHFEIHPGGGAATNPYPSVAAVC